MTPDLTLEPYIGADTFLDDDSDPSEEGEWSRYLGFYITYRGEKFCNFERASSVSEFDQVCSVVQELLSQVQDVVA